MNELTGQTMDWSPGAREAQVRQRFVDAWERALKGEDPPSIDELLAAFEEPGSVDFRRDLESIDSLFRQRLSGVEAAASAKRGPATVNLDRRGESTVAEAAGGKTAGVAALEPPSQADGADAARMTVTGVYEPDDLSPPRDANAETRAYFGDDTPAARPGKRLTPIPLPKAVAGYEILGVLGRGGMGVVYKARQPGLKRLVALKMILAGGHASADDLARFRSEAEAVAHLQHPNIVQIYEIGEDEGRPYFSLEFIDGESLSNKLEGKPQTPRQAAEIIHVLAQAMAVAHARGIVHRDLKPANILVTKEGTPKITDFGLAKRLEDEEGGQTRSGSILGTPDYMSPEQASGRIREVGPAADIYALGAMLYEMLAGRVPLKGASVLDTLQQVVAKEPVAPTQLEPKVPRDLETICLKCLRKDPAKRYPRIDDLAEDLRRFLAGEPILARPVAAPERLWRWCKRNPRVAVLSGALAILVMIWAGTASAMAWRLKVEKDATAAARDEAEENLRVSNRHKSEAEHSAQIARAHADQAELNASEAAVNAKAAKKQHERAVDLLIELGAQLEKRLQGKRSSIDIPQLRGLQQELLDMVSQAMSRLSKQLEDTKTTDFAMAATCNRLGELLFKLGHGEEALAQYRYGYTLVKQVVDSEPDKDLARSNLALLLMQMGKTCLAVNDDAKTALGYFWEARDLQQAIADQPHNDAGQTEKDHQRLLGFYEFHAGQALLHLGRPGEALKSLQAARDHHEAWVTLEPNDDSAISYLSLDQLWLGIANWHLNDLQATQDHFRKALGICGNLVERFPNAWHYKRDLGECYGDYCDAKLRLGLVGDARIAAEKSRELLEAYLAHDPDNVSEQPLLAMTYERQALVAARRGASDESRQRFNDARKLRSDLLLVDPNNQSWQIACALTLAHCGEHAAAAKQAQEVIDKSPDNVGLLLQAARCWAVCAADATAAEDKQSYRRRAIEAVRKATAGEYRDAVLLETDPELAPLSGDASYAAVLSEIKSRSIEP